MKADNSDAEKREKLVQTLAVFRKELDRMREQKAAILRKSHMRSGIMFMGGLGMCLAQLTGFTLGIYVISDWNEMEPWTWIIQAFYMMVGSWYFLLTRTDFCYTTAYQMLQDRSMHKLIHKEPDFSLEKLQALEEYVANLDRHLYVVLGEDLMEEQAVKK